MQIQRCSIQLGVRLQIAVARFSGCSDTTAGVNGRECLFQICICLSTSSFGTAGSDLLVKIRVLRVASASGRLRACCHIGVPPRRVEAARPQVQVVVLLLVQSQKVSLNLEVLLNLQVSSKRQPRRHAVLPNVPWSTRTLVSWLYMPSYDGNPDEPRRTPCILASKSTSHHALSALPEWF